MKGITTKAMAGLLALGCLGGCSRFKAEVWLFDRSCIDSPTTKEAVARARAGVAVDREAAFAQATRQLEAALVEYGEITGTPVEPDAVQSATKKLEDIARAEQKVSRDATSNPAQAYVDFQAVDAQLDTAREEVRAAIPTPPPAEAALGTPAEAAAVGPARERLDANINEAFDGLVFDGVYEDGNLAAVLYADRTSAKRSHRRRAESSRCWEKVADQARTLTSGGNSDVALVFDEHGRFSTKGLRLDASEVTAAIFKATQKGVELLGKIYGVPLAGGTAAGDESVDEEPKTEQEVEREELARRRAAVALVEALVAVPSGALADPGKRNTAIEHVEGILRRIRAPLDP
jgi:hypothetical protein